jgi:hypothetical protein
LINQIEKNKKRKTNRHKLIREGKTNDVLISFDMFHSRITTDYDIFNVDYFYDLIISIYYKIVVLIILTICDIQRIYYFLSKNTNCIYF